MEIRNPSYNRFGSIDCEVNHPVYGWIPFTATEDDPEGPEMYERALAMEPSPYTPAVVGPEEELAQWRAMAVCTPLQGKLALGEVKWKQVEDFLNDPETPWSLKQVVQSASVWERTSQNMDALAWAMDLSAEEVDELFRVAMTIQS